MVSVPVSGRSMMPFLHDQKDTVLFSTPDRPLKKGDIVFFIRDDGSYVMHRIYKVHADHTVDVIGDSQSQIETGIRQQQIFASIKKVNRNGKWIDPHHFIWKFYAKVWIHTIPFRKGMHAIKKRFS